jgi:hypothetical protein
MQLVRISQTPWGQKVLEGISWDLLPVAVGVGVLVIIVHAVYRAMRKHREAGARGTRGS